MMNKIVMILLTFMLLISLSACDKNAARKTNLNTKGNDKGTDDIYIQIISQGTLGAGERIVSLDTNVGFVDASTNLSETCPVYVNNYSYGQEGPLYDVTDTLKKIISDNLSRYLEILYDDYSSQEVIFTSDSGREYEVYYIRNSTEVRSRMNSISMLSSDYNISNRITDAEVLDNALVKAAITYLGITNPSVTRTIEYNTDGAENLYTYVITDETSDIFQRVFNRSFSCVTVKKYADLSDVIVQISDVSVDELIWYADYSVLPYSSVLTTLTSYYPNMDLSDIKAEIYYSATVQPGYFFPCYRFFIKDGVTTQGMNDTYTVVDVLLIDKSVDN